MGNFFTVNHIKNNGSREQFIKDFSSLMEKRGMLPCNEADSDETYIFTFSQGGWITFGSSEFGNDSTMSKRILQSVVDSLKLKGISIDVVDSDFAVIGLYEKAKGTIDSIVVGDGSGYGVEPMHGIRENFEPLLSDGKTWHDMLEILSENETLVEDQLIKISRIFGIDSDKMLLEYDDLMSESDAVTLYFKKSAARKMTLNAAFKKVFGEGLKELGYQRAKTKHPYFVRVVNEDILHIITYRKEWGCNNDWKVFDIEGGIATLYRNRLDLDKTPRDMHWLTSNFYIYGNTNEWNDDPESDFRKFRESIYEFTCDTRKMPLTEAFEYALEITRQIMLPYFEKFTDLETCVKNSHTAQIRMSLNEIGPECDFGNNIPGREPDEGILYFIVSPDICRTRYKQWIENNHNDEFQIKCLKYFEDIISDSAKMKLMRDEIERRKNANIEILRSYGIDYYSSLGLKE